MYQGEGPQVCGHTHLLPRVNELFRVTVKSLNDVDIAKTVTVETSELQIPKPM